MIDNSRSPLISIITIVFNAKSYLEQTIQSVLDQTYPNIEYIIIDGGSTDGTIDIIRKYSDDIDHWVSESDRGISDAFNKGISIAKGEWIGIINSGDWYEPHSCEVVANCGEYDFIFGTIRYWDGNRSNIDRAKPEIIYDDMRINHPTLFVKKKVYDEVGLYDLKYKIAMDYDLALRLFEAGKKYKNIDQVLANMRTDGVSQQFWVASKQEAKSIKVKQGVSNYSATKYLMTIRFKRYILGFLDRYNLSSMHRVYRVILNKD